MNIRNFFDTIDFEEIRSKVLNKDTFEKDVEIKVKNGKVRIRFNGWFIDEESAKRNWNGNNYLVGFEILHHGGVFGYSGVGGAVDDFWMFESWDRFKEWFDRKMESNDYYEVEEYGQICLF